MDKTKIEMNKPKNENKTTDVLRKSKTRHDREREAERARAFYKDIPESMKW